MTDRVYCRSASDFRVVAILEDWVGTRACRTLGRIRREGKTSCPTTEFSCKIAEVDDGFCLDCDSPTCECTLDCCDVITATSSITSCRTQYRAIRRRVDCPVGCDLAPICHAEQSEHDVSVMLHRKTMPRAGNGADGDAQASGEGEYALLKMVIPVSQRPIGIRWIEMRECSWDEFEEIERCGNWGCERGMWGKKGKWGCNRYAGVPSLSQAYVRRWGTVVHRWVGSGQAAVIHAGGLWKGSVGRYDGSITNGVGQGGTFSHV